MREDAPEPKPEVRTGFQASIPGLTEQISVDPAPPIVTRAPRTLEEILAGDTGYTPQPASSPMEEDQAYEAWSTRNAGRMHLLSEITTEEFLADPTWDFDYDPTSVIDSPPPTAEPVDTAPAVEAVDSPPEPTLPSGIEAAFTEFLSALNGDTPRPATEVVDTAPVTTPTVDSASFVDTVPPVDTTPAVDTAPVTVDTTPAVDTTGVVDTDSSVDTVDMPAAVTTPAAVDTPVVTTPPASVNTDPGVDTPAVDTAPTPVDTMEVVDNEHFVDTNSAVDTVDTDPAVDTPAAVDTGVGTTVRLTVRLLPDDLARLTNYAKAHGDSTPAQAAKRLILTALAQG
jgi:hypothetical protein